MNKGSEGLRLQIEKGHRPWGGRLLDFGSSVEVGYGLFLCDR